MSFALTEIELPIRTHWESPMTDEEFMSFCAANEPLRLERDANGEIIAHRRPRSDAGGQRQLCNGGFKIQVRRG